MKRFAVAWFNRADDDISLKLILAEDWRQAVVLHPEAKEWFSLEPCEGREQLPETLVEAQGMAFDFDCYLAVEEIL